MKDLEILVMKLSDKLERLELRCDYLQKQVNELEDEIWEIESFEEEEIL